jgi:hypothetical protein
MYSRHKQLASDHRKAIGNGLKQGKKAEDLGAEPIRKSKFTPT